MICGLENAKEQSKGEQRDVEEDHVEETTKFEITIKELMKENNTLKSLNFRKYVKTHDVISCIPAGPF